LRQISQSLARKWSIGNRTFIARKPCLANRTARDFS